MRARTVAAFAGLAALASCSSLEVPDLNNPGLDELQSRTGILTAATGLIIGTRGNFGSQNGYVAMLGIVGREAYNFDPADPRFVTEMLIGPLDGGSPAFGGNLWNGPYANIRNANLLLDAVEGTAVVSAGEKEGIRGFAKTIMALDFLELIVTRDSNGVPIDVNLPATAEPAPVAGRAAVYTHIANLLDSAMLHLNAPGASFPFALSAGFAGFTTPANFLKFNRALRARVAVYMNDWATALTALGASFLVADPAQLNLGVYHSFGTASGDAQNALFDPLGRAIYAHPSIQTDAQLRVGGAPDLRFSSKTTAITPRTVQGITSGLIFTIYTSAAAPVPIIRNEELILLRAEANIGLGQLATAITDIDFIRQNAGGLPPYGGAVTPGAVLDELLYNKRYSLLFEGGHRWIDMRHYDRLAQLPKDVPATHMRFSRFPFPINECNARATAPAGCGVQAGF